MYPERVGTYAEHAQSSLVRTIGNYDARPRAQNSLKPTPIQERLRNVCGTYAGRTKPHLNDGVPKSRGAGRGL